MRCLFSLLRSKRGLGSTNWKLIYQLTANPKNYPETMPDSLSNYFPEINDDLTKVTWAHGVNSREKLQRELNGSAMMIEADVVLGTLIGDRSQQLIPIMAHPPENTSDLSLEMFIVMFLDSQAAKGMKLDFKSREAFSASENILEEHLINTSYQFEYPIWLNADIIRGPVNSKKEPVDPDFFLSACVTKFPIAMPSVGWTTEYGNGIDTGSYTPEIISDMTEALNRNLVVKPVTFAVRAGLAAQSYDALTNLIGSSVPGTTLTIWCSSPNDVTDMVLLRKLIDDIGVDKVYLDLPPDMMEALKSSAGNLIGKCALIAATTLLALGKYGLQQ
ncbi:protein FAM151B isoform X2 [Cimex lectularius]|uniref:Menorin-like domain-containing protein n=1 Tax=Cimex lectularius TaxID=79782 RepID=A0A8I6RGR8_CIMLE|nr:protein FAM151B isoform X2 [Cimex lectularius]